MSTNIYIIDKKTSEVYFSLIPITSTSRLLGNVSNENGEISDLTSSQRICKGMINDLDGYTNIRKLNSVNSEIIGKIVDREVFTYWETNDNWYIVQTAKGIKGYVHKSRIRPVEERNEQKIRYYKVKNGDKIQDIAEKLGVSIDTICKLNRVKITTVLREGQALRISR
ncbi:LysM peptidoglycan-binding domain-containing protein [Bacteroides ovatus]|nr:LysM peptidoglycan-binding domain-containing protein [Bacteroides ovatus]